MPNNARTQQQNVMAFVRRRDHTTDDRAPYDALMCADWGHSNACVRIFFVYACICCMLRDVLHLFDGHYAHEPDRRKNCGHTLVLDRSRACGEFFVCVNRCLVERVHSRVYWPNFRQRVTSACILCDTIVHNATLKCSRNDYVQFVSTLKIQSIHK